MNWTRTILDGLAMAAYFNLFAAAVALYNLRPFDGGNTGRAEFGHEYTAAGRIIVCNIYKEGHDAGIQRCREHFVYSHAGQDLRQRVFSKYFA